MNVCLAVVILQIIKVVHGALEGYIVGGREARIEEWPFIIFMMYYRGSVPGPGCGGSILSSQTVLTAAHCLDDVTNSKKDLYKYRVSVFMGNVDFLKSTQHRLGIDYYTHENYDTSGTPNDIGILFLDRPIVFSAVVKKTVLQSRGLDPRKASHRNLKAAGWGAWANPVNLKKPLSPKLKAIAQRYITKYECLEHVQVEPGTMCAGRFHYKQYVFSGDSGGPLVTSNGFQVGLVSYKLQNENGVTIYTHIPEFFQWIRKAQRKLYKRHCGRSLRQGKPCNV